MKVLDAIWYNGGKGPSDGNNYWRRFTAAHYAIVSALIVIYGLWLSLALLALLGGYGVDEAVGSVISRNSPPFFVLAVISLVLCLWFASGRAWIAALGISVPLTAAALALRPMLNTAVGQTVKFMAPDVGEIALIAAAAALCPIVLALVARGHIRSVKARVIGALSSFFVAVLSGFLMYIFRG